MDKMISRPDFAKGVDLIFGLMVIFTINRLNPAISDFFMNSFLMFLVFTLYFYKRNENILLSLAQAFASVILVGVLTADDSMEYMKEKFDLIMPSTNSTPGCAKIKVQDLIDKFEGEDNLKKAMRECGVPYNLYLSDENAPEIATYIIQHYKKINDDCKM